MVVVSFYDILDSARIADIIRSDNLQLGVVIVYIAVWVLVLMPTDVLESAGTAIVIRSDNL